MKPNLIIVEGPDGAGKSTLIENLKRHFSKCQHVEVVHHGPYKGETRIAAHYLASMANSSYNVPATIILDRAWLSEYIYGPIYRDNVRITKAEERILWRAALGMNVIVINVDANFNTCVKNMMHREKDSYLMEDLETYRQVYDAFATEIEPMCDHYNAHYIHYNYKDDPDAKNIIARLTGKLTTDGVPTGYGSFNDGVFLMIGDRPGRAREGDEAVTEVPFAGLHYNGCSMWLADKLEQAGIPESELFWINAFDRNGNRTSSDFVRDLDPAGVIALGMTASHWAEDAGLRAVTIIHPSAARRFPKRCYDYMNLKKVFKTAQEVMGELRI